MSLKNELRDVIVTKDDTVASYFMRISRLRDQLKAIGEANFDTELVTTTLNGFLDSQDLFASSICGRKDIPCLEELWSSCIQEESRLVSKGKILRIQEGDSQAVVVHSKNGRGRRNFGRFQRNVGRRPPHFQGKKDMSKIQCFRCHKYGHCQGKCSEENNNRKRKDNHQASTTNNDDDEHPHKKKSKNDATKAVVAYKDEDMFYLVDKIANRF